MSLHSKCRRCGYDVTGLPIEGACPECGLALRGGLEDEDFSVILGVLAIISLGFAGLAAPLVGAGAVYLAVRARSRDRRSSKARAGLMLGVIALIVGCVVASQDMLRFADYLNARALSREQLEMYRSLMGGGV